MGKFSSFPKYKPNQENTGNGNGNNEPPKPLEAINVVDLLKKELPALQWIIPDILPEGLTLLASRPKIGKSMLALALSLRLARRMNGGIDGEVLYLALEDSERRLQSRTYDLLQGSEIEPRLWFVFEAKTLDDGKLIKQLGMWINQHPDTCLIVIDIFAKVKPRRKTDDVYKNDYDAMKELQLFAQNNHLAILLVHHSNKRVDTEDWIDSISGSTGNSGATDTLWLLTRTRQETTMNLKVTGRDVEEVTMLIDLNDLGEDWKIAQEKDVPDLNISEQKVLQALDKAPDGLKPKQIAELAGLNNVRMLMRRMEAKGLVSRSPSTHGLYVKSCQESQSHKVTTPKNLVTLSDAASQAGLEAKVTNMRTDTENGDACYFV